VVAKQNEIVVSNTTPGVSRRTVVGRLVVGGAAATFFAHNLDAASAQDATPSAGECVATAPPAQDGVGLASLLVGGIVRDMPAGPVEVRIARFTLEPGASAPPATLPYPALMYIETGESTCPGNPRQDHVRRGRRGASRDDRGGGRSRLPGRHHMVHPRWD
jgi:hypothetical protein